MNRFKLLIILLAAALALAACEQDGPFEEAGEKIDQTADDIGDEMEDACESVKEGVGAEDDDC